MSTEYKLPIQKDFIGKTINIPEFPELRITYLNAENHLCPSIYGSTIKCFWEGDLSVTLDVNGYQVILNDHDQKKSNVSIVSINGSQYTFQGTGPYIVNKSRAETYLVFTIKKMAKGQTGINVGNYSMRTMM